MTKNRGRLDIAVDVLSAAESGVCKTRIMVLANLSQLLLERYLKIVIDGGFLRVGDSHYEVTEKGRKLLE
jgi:predicted transcriptional regulator